MKKRYWILIGISVIIVFITYLTVEKKVSEYFFLKRQQHRIENDFFVVFQTIDQYSKLFGMPPSSFDDKKLNSMLKKNLADSLVFNLKPSIKKNASTKMYYVYLNGPDGQNDSLRKIINEDYVPTKTKILGISMLQYLFSKGDVFLGSSSYFVPCDLNKMHFIYIDNEYRIHMESDSVRKAFYSAVNVYIKNYIKEKNLKPASKTYLAYCSFKFDEIVSSSVLCVSDDSNAENINGFMAEIANYVKDKIPGIKELYFSIHINEALILP